MKLEIEALARHPLERAREAFGEGQHLMAKRAFTGAVNRFYYAAFHGARSLLATKQVDSSRHSGVISPFQDHFVKTGQVALETAKALPRAYEKRQKTDHGDFATIEPGEAERIREEVQAFIEECGRLLDRLISEG